MTANEFIKALRKAKDLDIAEISFWIGDKKYELESMGQFSIIPDITINLKKAAPEPILMPIKHFRRDARKKVKAVERKIKKEIHGKTK